MARNILLENLRGVKFHTYRERLGHISGTIGVSLSVGITRQVVHGTLLIFGDGLLF